MSLSENSNRTCADGSNKKSYLKEGGIISSPTVSLEALLCTLIVDSHEGRDMATFDVYGSYLHAEMPRYKSNLINTIFSDIMCQVNPEYEQHARYENGENVSYILVLGEIYDCIESGLFCYKLFYIALEGLVL